MILIFYVFALLVLWQSFVSLLGGIRFLRYVREEVERSRSDFVPFASVVVACRGRDEGFAENVGALWQQDYPRYEIIFVFDSDRDAAREAIEDVRRRFEGTPFGDLSVRTVVAGRATDSGQKVHNLRAGVHEADARSDAFVFVDTDARPGAGWLRALVAPLADERVGAATGYRWFVPDDGGFASHLRAVWNSSIASALGANGERNFCWGGSTAIRRTTFERLGVAERWRGTLSDDFALTRMLHRAKLPIRFVPRCLVPSYEGCTFAGLIEFTTRQVKITRVYAAPLWHIVLWSNLVFMGVFVGGIVLALYGIFSRSELLPPPLLFVAGIYLLGVAKAHIRLRAVRLALAPRASGWRAATCAQLFLFPLTAALYLYNALAALFSRRIVWRGIEYELKSATETAIISHPHHATSLCTEPHERGDSSYAE